jgi:hypothetical protein
MTPGPVGSSRIRLTSTQRPVKNQNVSIAKKSQGPRVNCAGPRSDRSRSDIMVRSVCIRSVAFGIAVLIVAHPFLEVRKRAFGQEVSKNAKAALKELDTPHS